MPVIESKFEKFNRSDPLVQKLITFLSDSTADALFHIDLYELADKWQVKRKQAMQVRTKFFFQIMY